MLECFSSRYYCFVVFFLHNSIHIMLFVWLASGVCTSAVLVFVRTVMCLVITCAHCNTDYVLNVCMFISSLSVLEQLVDVYSHFCSLLDALVLLPLHSPPAPSISVQTTGICVKPADAAVPEGSEDGEYVNPTDTV